MERSKRARSKSTSASAKKAPPARSRSRGRPKKVKSEEKPRPRSASRSRGRPRTKPEPEKQKRARSRSSSKTRSVSRPRPTPKKREKSSEKEQTLRKAALVLNDVLKDEQKSKALNDAIRRSLSKEVTSNAGLVRRSTRVAAVSAREEISSIVSTNKKFASRVAQAASKVEFGGSWGALIFLIISTGLFVVNLLGCTKEQCTLQPFPIPRNWRLYFNIEGAGIVLGFVLLQTLLLLLPIGKIVKVGTGSASYRSNGFLALVLTGAGVAGAWYLGQPVTLVYERWVSIGVSAYILGLLIAVGLYIKGGRAPVPGLNPYGNSGRFVYDFFMGRELNPVLLKRINVKILLFRCLLIGSLLLDVLHALKGYEVRKEVSPTLGVAVALHAIYIVDSLWFENTWPSTFEVQSEGLGAMNTIGYLIYPSWAALTARFILTHRVELPQYQLAIIVASFVLGFFIYRGSNIQKAAFRKNPLDPNLAKLETISTNRGKKLLVSGWWGIVKHPNYLGDIILHWAWAATAGLTHVLPYNVALLTTLALVHRAKRDDRRCQERYGDSWTEYSKRVPNRIIPRVY